MDRVIVTIRLKEHPSGFDMELPLDQKTEDVMQDLADSLAGVDTSLWFDSDRIALFDERSNRKLEREKTLREECVWNGDILRVVGRDK